MVDWGALFVTYYVLAVPSIFFYLRNIAVKQRKRHARLEADDARARARWKQARAEKEKRARVSRRKSAGKSGDDLKAALVAEGKIALPEYLRNPNAAVPLAGTTMHVGIGTGKGLGVAPESHRPSIVRRTLQNIECRCMGTHCR